MEKPTAVHACCSSKSEKQLEQEAGAKHPDSACKAKMDCCAKSDSCSKAKVASCSVKCNGMGDSFAEDLCTRKPEDVKSSTCCDSAVADIQTSCCDRGECVKVVDTAQPKCCTSSERSSCKTETKVVPRDPEKSSCCKGLPMDCCGESSCCCEGNNECCKNALHLKQERKTGKAQTKKSKVKRSTFFVEKICCASEVASIRSNLSPLKGVDTLRVNTTSKMLYVNHDVECLSAAEIAASLNSEGFGVRIEQDGALESNAISCYVSSVLSLDDLGTNDSDTLVDFLVHLDSNAVQNAVVDIEAGLITVVHNALLMPLDDIVKSLRQTLGVQSTIRSDGKESLMWDFPDIQPEDHEDAVVEPSGARLRPAVFASGVLWVVSMLSFIGGNWEYLKYVALLSIAFGLPPIAMKAFLALRHCRFDVNCLMAFASIGAIALQDFTEAAAVTFLFALSDWLEARATNRARKALSSIIQLRPEKANLIHPVTGEIVVVPVGAVPVGALVSIKAGDKIPCDGIVMEGISTVDESSLTGESRPVVKGPNDAVSGGTINFGNTQMTVRTTASADDSAVARLIRLVEEAQANRSETEKLVDEFARIYTPLVVSVALAMCSIPWAWGREVGAEWTELGLVLIVVACPCALIISTPVSYVAGLAATAQRGVLIKGGAHLEALGLVKTVCFDKTGTLTQGSFQMLQFNTIGNKTTRSQALEYLALMEERASHPLAKALVQGAQGEGVKIPQGRFVRNHTCLPGEGVSGVVDGSTLHVGNTRLFQRLDLYNSLTEAERTLVEGWETIGTVGFMSIGDEGIVCAFCVADAVRPESATVVARLKALGVDSLMLTGDHRKTALSIGQVIGLAEEDIRSELLPEEKLLAVSELKCERSGGQSILSSLCSERKLVLMCGDGVNDAPALATADVGVAVVGSALAMETADVTLMDSNLEKLVYSIEMGRSVIRKIKENVIFSLFVKFLVLGFALAGKAALWAAIASDVGAMLLVTLNSMMLLPAKNSKQKVNAEVLAEKKLNMKGKEKNDDEFYKETVDAELCGEVSHKQQNKDYQAFSFPLLERH